MTRSVVGSGKPGPGRPPGSRNKTTVIAKDAIALAADKLGGIDRLVAWAKEDAKNESAFWTTIYPKLMPLQVDAQLSGEIAHRVTRVERAIVDPAHPDG